MSSVQNNLTSYFGNALMQVDKANTGKTLVDDDRINQLFGFVDQLIQNDGKLGDVSYSNHDIVAGFTQFLAANTSLVNEVQQRLAETKLKALSDLHIKQSKQELAPELLKSVEIMDRVSTDLRAEIAKNPIAKVSDKNYDMQNALNFFNKHVEAGLKEVFKLPEEERTAAYDTQMKTIFADTVKIFGADLSTQLADSIDHQVLPFKLQQLAAKSPGELPALEITEGLEAQFNEIASAETTLTKPEQEEVLTLIDKFMAKEVDEMQLKAEYGALNTEQKLYMEHLRQAAKKIDGSSDIINTIVNKLGSKLPELIVPAIIGLLFGSVTGFGALGGFGAIALSLLGGNDSNENTTKQRPPLPMSRAEQKESSALVA